MGQLEKHAAAEPEEGDYIYQGMVARDRISSVMSEFAQDEPSFQVRSMVGGVGRRSALK